MMGTKIRDFAPLPDLSLEELVPKDNFLCFSEPPVVTNATPATTERIDAS